MPKTELPPINIVIQIHESSYTSPISGDTYTQKAFEARGSTGLTQTGKDYKGCLVLIPENHRMSVLDEIVYLIQREEELKAEGKNPREVLQDSLFERQIKGNPYLWTHSHIALCATKGAKNIGRYIDTDGQGRKYARVDYKKGDKIIAEGVPVPISLGGKIVEWNPSLRIPAIVSDSDEQHTIHWHLDTDEKEVAVQLCGYWCLDEHGRCLALGASFRRSLSYTVASFRLFQGSLDDVPDQVIEYFVKDKESYEKGLQIGIEKGKIIGITEGRDTAISELIEEIGSIFKKYKK